MNLMFSFLTTYQMKYSSENFFMMRGESKQKAENLSINLQIANVPIHSLSAGTYYIKFIS